MFQNAPNLDPRVKRPTLHDLAYVPMVLPGQTPCPEPTEPTDAVKERLARLSKREIEVLRYLSIGLTSKETAHILHLSVHTVNNHRKNMMSAARVQNMTELVCLAKQAQMI